MHIALKLENEKLRPFRAHPTDAGADLFTKCATLILPGEQKMIDTGVALKIPQGFVGYIFNRSSQGKLGIQIANGTGIIDSDYRGNLKVLLKNTSQINYLIIPYVTRIAQLVISPVITPDFYDTSETEAEWLDTKRGAGGFGSSDATYQQNLPL